MDAVNETVECTRKRRLVAFLLFYGGSPIITLAALFLNTVFGWPVAVIFFLSVSLINAILYDLYLYSSWKSGKSRLTNWTRTISIRRVLWSVSLYLVLYFIAYLFWYGLIGTVPSDAAKNFLTRNIQTTLFIVCAMAFLYGLAIRDILRYRLHMFVAPLIVISVFLLAVIGLLAAHPGEGLVKQFLHVADSHFWAIVTLIAIVIWKPQIAKLIPRIQKAELPGGPKFEIEKIDELQKSINPWKKTVSRFAELMEWVGDLILDTPPEDVVTLLAYTPALGYLTRTEAEWRPLHRLIVERPNVRLICLKQEELAEWHGRFAGKKTARPEGTISATLIDKANRISADLVADKKRQIDPRQTFVFEKGLEELPGYYLFANSKRAIIAVPLFLPSDPKKFAPETDADGYLGNTPVKMLGFESSDNWTVWLVKEVCDHYANLKRKDTQVLDLSKMEDTRPSDTSAIAPDGDFRSQRVLSLPRYYDSVRRTAVTSGLSRNEIESYSLFLVVCLWEC